MNERLKNSDVGEEFTPARVHTEAGWDKPIPYIEKSLSSIERRASLAFTLIELLTVMAIIVALAGLTMGVSSYANRKALESRAKAEIRAMELALEAYKADNGAYPPLDADMFNGTPSVATNTIATGFSVTPTTTNVVTGVSANTIGWLNIHFVYRALNPGGGAKNYMTFTGKQLKTLINTQNGVAVSYRVILDPLGNPYGYAPRYPPTPWHNATTFDLWSAGIDGNSGYPVTNLIYTLDDIGNWQK